MSYIINSNTMAIIPCGKSKARVIESENIYVVHSSASKIIERSCEYFGSDYKSRLISSQQIVKTRYKPPVIVEETRRLVFFPVNSCENNGTLWINFSKILEFYKKEQNKKYTVVHFRNGYQIDIDTSYYSFNNQYLKAASLCAILTNRIFNY